MKEQRAWFSSNRKRWCLWCPFKNFKMEYILWQNSKSKPNHKMKWNIPTILYGSQCWALKGQHVRKMGVVEMRMLRWMCDYTIKENMECHYMRDDWCSTHWGKDDRKLVKVVWAFTKKRRGKEHLKVRKRTSKRRIRHP